MADPASRIRSRELLPSALTRKYSYEDPRATKYAIRRRSGDQSGSPMRRSGSCSNVSCRDSPVARLVAHKLAWLPLSET